MIQQPTTYTPVPSAEFNAIKINISGAKVDAPQHPHPAPAPAPAQLPANTGNNLNYTA